MEDNKKGIISLLIITIIILLVLVILLATGIISFKSTELNNSPNNEKQEPVNEYYDTKINTIDINQLDMSKLDSTENINNSILQKITIGDKTKAYNIQINLDGKIHIYGNDNYSTYSDGELTNNSNAVQVIEFAKAAPIEEQLCYILTSNGKVYSYRVGDVFDKKLTASKIDSISDIKRLFIYSHGQSWELIAIDKNNLLTSLAKEGV